MIYGFFGSGKIILMVKVVEIVIIMKFMVFVFRYRFFREMLNKGLNKREFYFFFFFLKICWNNFWKFEYNCVFREFYKVDNFYLLRGF